jgi:hypothetical protein
MDEFSSVDFKKGDIVRIIPDASLRYGYDMTDDEFVGLWMVDEVHRDDEPPFVECYPCDEFGAVRGDSARLEISFKSLRLVR